MIRLCLYELSKIWKKKNFIVSVCVLLTVNIFLLWYVNLPDDETPSLSVYKTINYDIHSMSESEKGEYLLKLKSQEEYTDVADELYKEYRKVSEYDDYLKSVRKNKDTLSEISIFNEGKNNSFSERNIKKSAADYEKMEGTKISWQPQRGVTLATENIITDILMFLGMMLFVSGLIIEEKEKKLFYVTRATKGGKCSYMFGKTGALLIHSFTLSAVLIGCNVIFSLIATGPIDFTSGIQSIAVYMESCLDINVMEYILLTIITKASVLFCFGVFLTAVAIACNKGFMPYLAGVLLLGFGALLYEIIPAQSSISTLKYLNFIGSMESCELYGSYMNLNINEHPVSRLLLTWIVLIFFIIVGVTLCLILYFRGNNLELKKITVSRFYTFRPHNSLIRHEAYKLLVINHGAIILLGFAVLIGYYGISQNYRMSAGEEYYQNVMLQLEGELTKEKESLILAEQARFEEAFKKIEEIDKLISNNEIDVLTGDSLKTKWEVVLYLYPSFERINLQYDRIREDGGEFIYDTGYLYLLGKMDNSMTICALMMSVCMVFAFHNAISMEYTKNSWNLLTATAMGRRKILICKKKICIMSAMLLSVIPWIFRSIPILKIFPANRLLNPIQSIPAFENVCVNMPIIVFILSVFLLRMFLNMCVAMIVVFISDWRKNEVQSLFFCLLILVLPMVLNLMGFDFARWFSIPLYYDIIYGI